MADEQNKEAKKMRRAAQIIKRDSAKADGWKELSERCQLLKRLGDLASVASRCSSWYTITDLGRGAWGIATPFVKPILRC